MPAQDPQHPKDPQHPQEPDLVVRAAPVPPERRAQLGVLIAARRAELGLSVRAAALNGGLDQRTWARVEEGVRVQPSRLDALDDVLSWTPGASNAYLAGRVEHPAEHTPPVPRDLSYVEVVVAASRAVAEAQRYLDELLRRQARRR